MHEVPRHRRRRWAGRARSVEHRRQRSDRLFDRIGSRAEARRSKTISTPRSSPPIPATSTPASKAARPKDTLVLRDADDHEISIPRSTIDTRRTQPHVADAGRAGRRPDPRRTRRSGAIPFRIGKSRPLFAEQNPNRPPLASTGSACPHVDRESNRRRSFLAMDAGLQPRFRRSSAHRFAQSHRRRQRAAQHPPLPPRIRRRGKREIQTEFRQPA